MFVITACCEGRQFLTQLAVLFRIFPAFFRFFFKSTGKTFHCPAIIELFIEFIPGLFPSPGKLLILILQLSPEFKLVFCRCRTRFVKVEVFSAALAVGKLYKRHVRPGPFGKHTSFFGYFFKFKELLNEHARGRSPFSISNYYKITYALQICARPFRIYLCPFLFYGQIPFSILYEVIHDGFYVVAGTKQLCFHSLYFGKHVLTE